MNQEKDTIRCIWHEGTLFATVNGDPVPLEPSRGVFNHSQEFSIGYPGSGVAQLALAILLMYDGMYISTVKKTFNKIAAVHLHQEFKFQFLTDPTYQKEKMGEDHPFEIQVNIPSWIIQKMTEVHGG